MMPGGMPVIVAVTPGRGIAGRNVFVTIDGSPAGIVSGQILDPLPGFGREGEAEHRDGDRGNRDEKFFHSLYKIYMKLI